MTQKNSELTPRQSKAIAALLEYPTVGAAADAIKVRRRTIYRWLELPEFRVALYQAEGAAIDSATRKLFTLSEKAFEALKDVIDNPSQSGATNKRMAAQAVFDYLLKMRDRNIEVRLTNLEAKVYG